MAIQKARKYQHKLRVGLAGPTGSGKTYTALKLAAAIVAKEGGRVGVIDTEHGSASLYADAFDFDVIELKSFAPDRYVEAINEFARAGGYTLLIVDSLTHAWNGKDGALEQVDRKAGAGGNSFTAWRDVTPQHTRLVDALLTCPFHLIGTLRSKMAYEVDTDPRTKKVTVRKLGLQPIQREGMEYEMDVFCDLDADNTLSISKTRNAALSGYSVQKAGDELGLLLWEWAQGDAAPEPATAEPEPGRPDAEPAQQPGRPSPPATRSPVAKRLTPPEQLAGLGEADGTVGAKFYQAIEDATLTKAMLAAVAPGKTPGTLNPGMWLLANPDKTLRDLISAVVANERAKDEDGEAPLPPEPDGEAVAPCADDAHDPVYVWDEKGEAALSCTKCGVTLEDAAPPEQGEGAQSPATLAV